MAKPRKPDVRKGMPDVALTKEQFVQRFRERFFDPAFTAAESELARLAEIAWDGYSEYRKSPRTAKAGRAFADPSFDLPVEWLAARRKLQDAEKRQRNPRTPSRILLVNGSPRSDQSCPGELSKTFRLLRTAQRVIARHRGFETDVLDLSRLTSEYGRQIHPCKACVSTAMPLCHWPCSCYPNHALGQVNDWMAEIYERWVAAHGVLILCPVHWYQAPSALKLMIDRLVCADGGNPDPTSTGGKDPARAKQLELKGWHYPKHLAGRAFAVVVHGDAAGPVELRRMLADWLTDMELVPAEPPAMVDAFVGYYRPYATSHADLDHDEDLQLRVRNSARALIAKVKELRSGRRSGAAKDLERPVKK